MAAEKVFRSPMIWMRAGLLLLCLAGQAASSAAADPKQDTITATCGIDPAQVDRTALRPIRIRMTALDSQKHALAYIWSGDGGVIEGAGAEVTVQADGLAPGTYTYTGIAQDAYRNRAECSVELRIAAPPPPLEARCSSVQQQVESGQPAHLEVVASGISGGEPRIAWFSNGGRIRGAARAVLDTAGLPPADYTATARVEDAAGRATDCSVQVRVLAAPPPPPEPDLVNLGQIVFPRNVGFLAAADVSRLEAVARSLPALGRGYVSVEAYAAPDERDWERLAATRAAAVKQLLIGKGIPEEMIRVRVGLGGRLGGVRNRTLDMVFVPEGFTY